MASPSPLDPLDRIVIAYLAVPLVIFLAGWFEAWAAVPLLACVAYALKALLSALPGAPARWPVTRLQLSVALVVACAWTVCGGIGHWVFANADWHVRDAVLHDLGRRANGPLATESSAAGTVCCARRSGTICPPRCSASAAGCSRRMPPWRYGP